MVKNFFRDLILLILLSQIPNHQGTKAKHILDWNDRMTMNKAELARKRMKGTGQITLLACCYMYVMWNKSSIFKMFEEFNPSASAQTLVGILCTLVPIFIPGIAAAIGFPINWCRKPIDNFIFGHFEHNIREGMTSMLDRNMHNKLMRISDRDKHLRAIFFRIIDNDASLSKLSEEVMNNGVVVTNSLSGVMIAAIAACASFAHGERLFFLAAIVLTIFSLICLAIASKIHTNLNTRQIEQIRNFRKQELNNEVAKL